jgi:starch-binding outer membrane protein, SusD/RagB family
MNMKKFIILVSLAAFSFIFASCEMDLVPTTAIELEQGFKTYADAEKFANGLNTRFRGLHYGIFSFTYEVQGEMFNATPDYGNRNGSPHRMDGSFTTSDYSLRDVWQPSYNAIMNINNFIDNVDKVTRTTQAQEDNLVRFKGFAHFYRAHIYHDLVRRFAKDYEPASAATDLGVPLILKYNVTEKPARSTVAQVYAQIEDDLAKAATFLTTVPGTLRSETPTLDAVRALDARVKLYMHKFTEAAALAQQVIATGRYNLANSAGAMTNEFVNDNGPESIMQMFASLTETGGRANTIYLNFVPAANRYSPDFVPTQTCLNLYEPADLRYQSWFATFPCRFTSGDVNLVLFNKYSGNPTLFTAPTRTYMHKVKIFRIAEMYLIRAEALLSQASPDEPGARAALQAIQTARGATLTATATLAAVKLEWNKEMIGEGFKVDWMKRWKEGFTNRVPQNVNHVVTGAGFTTISVPANFPKLVWAIPQTDMDVNTNLDQNDGW